MSYVLELNNQNSIIIIKVTNTLLSWLAAAITFINGRRIFFTTSFHKDMIFCSIHILTPLLKPANNRLFWGHGSPGSASDVLLKCPTGVGGHFLNNNHSPYRWQPVFKWFVTTSRTCNWEGILLVCIRSVFRLEVQEFSLSVLNNPFSLHLNIIQVWSF
jgi:hypothetical protein